MVGFLPTLVLTACERWGGSPSLGSLTGGCSRRDDPKGASQLQTATDHRI